MTDATRSPQVHTKWTPVPENGSFISDHLIHTGQFFVDDGLNAQIDKVLFSLFRSYTYHPANLNPVAPCRCGPTTSTVNPLLPAPRQPDLRSLQLTLP